MTRALEPYIAEWERFRRQPAGGAAHRLTDIREDAWRRFLAVGFPTTRDEEWRFTSVAPIADRAFTLAPDAPSDGPVAWLDRYRRAEAAAELVFVDGHYAAALSRRDPLPRGVSVERLADSPVDRASVEAHLGRIAPVERHPFVALNTAFLADGAAIQLPPGAIVERPVHLLFAASPGTRDRSRMAHPRVLIVLGANSRIPVVETYVGPDGASYFTNAVSEIVLGENAVLDHYRLQYEGRDAYHVGAVHVRAARSSSCASHAIAAGGALVRNDIVATLNGEGAECTLNGLYVADGQRLVDNHTVIDHAQPHCASREIYKGVLADRARGVFNGKIIVRPDAQKTDAKQTNRALLLSEDALINTKPQLEIFANDVKCTHGAAVGQLDDEAVFYLRSRGFSEASARQLLIHAFAADVLNRLPLAGIRSAVEDRLQQQLARALRVAA